jgi:asparagine synthase (glutamine-hydrolysing)
MCGIGGVMFFDGAGETRAREIGSLLEGALRHRGPDGGDVWSHSSGGVSVALAHRRLAILDLSTAASQPMVSDRGSVLTYNGEVYNFGDLRRDLEAAGHAFASTSDTEVVLQALESWDRDALPRFDGMFAFGYWDAPAQRLLLARDRFGIKPLYYFAGDGLFVFASVIRAFMSS